MGFKCIFKSTELKSFMKRVSFDPIDGELCLIRFEALRNFGGGS